MTARGRATRGMKRTEAVAAREREEEGSAGRDDLSRKKAGLCCVKCGKKDGEE